LPGVASAAVVNRLPLSGTATNSLIVTEGTETAPIPVTERPLGDIRSVNPEYFGTLGIRLLHGEIFRETDVDRSVALVSASMARRAWPGQNPVGKRFRISFEPKRLVEVIGVVADVRGLSLESEPPLTVYLPYWQRNFSDVSIAVRASTDPLLTGPAVREAIREIDSDIPTYAVRTMADVVDASMAQRRFTVVLLLLFAAVAVLLAAVGIYGVLSYTVTQRTKEIGIRGALGASGGSLQRLVIGDAWRLVAAGVVSGIPAALAAGSIVRHLLFGVTPQDLGVLAGACGIVAVVATMSAYLPARRAVHIHPTEALRAE
jgi:putative ABC transport system permease protein